MKNKKGFTLIELLAVLVVLAILALISIPITIRIINNARENSYKRSIESYAKTFEKYIAMDNIDSATSDYDLLYNYKDKIDGEYYGNRVVCEFDKNVNDNDELSNLIDGKLILRWCKVNNSKEYKYESGNVTEEIEYDSYGIGKEIILNEEKYYVISKSSSKRDYVTLLKDDFLKEEEINFYGGVGTENNHVNRYSYDFSQGHAQDGGAAFYPGPNCEYKNNQWINIGCTNDYDKSDVKYIIDAWAADKFKNNELKIVDGYKARLVNELEINQFEFSVCDYNLKWFGKGYYWTMRTRPSNFDNYYVGYIYPSSDCNYSISSAQSYTNSYKIRPVINVKKSAIEKSD